MILWLDIDDGTRSVASRITNGQIKAVRTDTYKDVEREIRSVRDGVHKDVSMIVIDTLTMLAANTRLAIVQDPETMGNALLWDNRSRLQATMQNWGTMSDLLGRLIRSTRTIGVPLVLVCHEGEREDLQTGLTKAGPDFNAALYKDIIALSDAIVRLSITSDATKIGDKEYGPGTRVLRLAPSAQATAGVRVDGALPPPPPVIFEPTMTKFLEAVGADGMRVLCVYGAPKNGKTTFVATYADYLESLTTTSTKLTTKKAS